jgi:hypothetical protein
MLQRTVSEANLESVFCVDPEGKLEGDLVSGLRNSAVIFQSWHFDRYAATASALRW